mgnify:CR=1 FL=1
MTTSVLDSFYDNVAVPCPSCGSLDVAIYSYVKEDGESVVEGRCANCNGCWYMS